MTNEDLMRAYYAAYNADQDEQIAALLAEDVILASPAGTREGREAYLDTFRWMTEHFADTMIPTDISGDDDGATVAIENNLIAKQDVADFMGRSVAEGERIVLKLTGRYAIEASRITRITIEPA